MSQQQQEEARVEDTGNQGREYNHTHHVTMRYDYLQYFQEEQAVGRQKSQCIERD